MPSCHIYSTKSNHDASSEVYSEEYTAVFIQSYRCSSSVGCGAGSSSGHCSNHDDGSNSFGGFDGGGAWAPQLHHFPYLIETEGNRYNNVTQRRSKHKHERLIQPINQLWVCNRHCSFSITEWLWWVACWASPAACMWPTIDVLYTPSTTNNVSVSHMTIMRW